MSHCCNLQRKYAFIPFEGWGLPHPHDQTHSDDRCTQKSLIIFCFIFLSHIPSSNFLCHPNHCHSFLLFSSTVFVVSILSPLLIHLLLSCFFLLHPASEGRGRYWHVQAGLHWMSGHWDIAWRPPLFFCSNVFSYSIFCFLASPQHPPCRVARTPHLYKHEASLSFMCFSWFYCHQCTFFFFTSLILLLFGPIYHFSGMTADIWSQAWLLSAMHSWPV